MLRPALLAAAVLLVGTAHADAGIIFNFRGSDVDALEGGPTLALTVDGLTATLVANQGAFSRSGSSPDGDFGINSLGSGDEASQIDGDEGAESVSITFDGDVTFDRLALSSTTATDEFFVNFQGGSSNNESGPDDEFFYTVGNTLTAGQTVTIGYTAGNGFSFDEFEVTTLSAQAVPEPTSMALLGLSVAGFGLAGVRRRRAASSEARA